MWHELKGMTRKELVIFVDHHTCQENIILFEKYVEELGAAFPLYDTKVRRELINESVLGDWPKTSGISRVHLDGFL